MTIMIEVSRREALTALLRQGKSVPEAAADLEIPVATAYRWDAEDRRARAHDWPTLAEQQQAAADKLSTAIETFYRARAAMEEAIIAACQPPLIEPSTTRPLVKRQDIVDMTRNADPAGVGLTIYELRQIVDGGTSR
ncbi:hypothetical protein ACIBG8_07530 [Nonomuraea sp. NPDC050556]|uniref:hypothetical protein n=1 Tax=Nonomuraea sp. NPDC050556 TaxID=3364369 RepID=UPI00379CCBA6